MNIQTTGILSKKKKMCVMNNWWKEKQNYPPKPWVCLVLKPEIAIHPSDLMFKINYGSSFMAQNKTALV